jgi:hypothetical protein
MNRFLSLAAGAALLISSTVVHAGGLSDQVVETPVIVADTPAPAASSISPAYVVLGVLAALLIAAAVSEDDDEAGAATAASDMRLKQDITRIGTAANGLPIYSYRYIGHDQLFSGVMAQDVLQHTPEAVITFPGGLMAVNYDMLGLKMEHIN